MRRGCLFGIVGLLGVCVIACALGYFVGLPRVRDGVRKPFEEAIGTQVARQIAPTPGEAPEPGTYVLSAADLNDAIQREIAGNNSFDGVAVTITPAQFEIRFSNNDQDVTYQGNVATENGRLKVTDISGSGWLTTILPPDNVAASIEKAINGYLIANNLSLTDAELGNGTLTLTTARG